MTGKEAGLHTTWQLSNKVHPTTRTYFESGTQFYFIWSSVNISLSFLFAPKWFRLLPGLCMDKRLFKYAAPVIGLFTFFYVIFRKMLHDKAIFIKLFFFLLWSNFLVSDSLNSWFLLFQISPVNDSSDSWFLQFMILLIHAFFNSWSEWHTRRVTGRNAE